VRILYLGPYPPPYGGVETHLVALRDVAIRRGHIAEVVNITRHRKISAHGVHYPQSAVGVAWILFTGKWDVIHLHAGGRLTKRILALGLVMSLVPGARTVFTFHSGGFPGTKAAKRIARSGLAALILRRLDAVIGVNEQLVAFFERVGVPGANIHLTVPAPPVDDTLLDEEPPTDDLRSFMDTHGPVLLSVGGLEPEYDIPLQIRAFGRIRATHPDAGLLIVGSGSLHDQIEELRSKQAHADHIRVAGDVEHRRTLQLMVGANVLLRTTWYDGDAISVREGLTLGVPVIATDNGMRPDGVHLIPVGSDDALVAAIESVLPVADRPRATVDAAAQNNDLDRTVSLYEDLIRTL